MEGSQVSIIRWWNNRYRACASCISVTEVVGKSLQPISSEVVFVPQDMIMSWTASALDASMTAQVEVKTQ
uniref:Uncharacterized protein n=1 Tax=Arundo donax TaxID=35708 RepID=A0A0A9ATA9_ARUDO